MCATKTNPTLTCNPPKTLVLGCGALANELIALLGQNPDWKTTIDLQCLPASLHNSPHLITERLDSYLEKYAEGYSQVFIAYADCGSAGGVDKIAAKYGAERIKGAHCYEFFAGANLFTEMIDQELGSFFVTDFLAKNFERLVVRGLGLDRYPELFELYFAHYKRIVYLAQSDAPVLRTKMAEQARQWGLQFVYQPVGMGELETYIAPILASGR